MNRAFWKKYYLFVVFFILLLTAVCMELCGSITESGEFISNLESKLHKKELEADECLKSLDTLGDFSESNIPKDVAILVVQDSSILFWSDSRVCSDDITSKLIDKASLVYVNNAFYDVRTREMWGLKCYALIHIKDQLNIQGVDNNFATFFNVALANANQATIFLNPNQGQYLITDIDGEQLFSISFINGFRDYSVNYWLLSIYGLLLILLFFLYDKILFYQQNVSLQVLTFVVFSIFLGVLYMLLVHFDEPDSVFRLSIFNRENLYGENFLSVGELLIYVYSIFQIMSITIYRIKSDKKRLVPYRFYIMLLWTIFVYLYVNLYSFAISSLIKNFDICLNVAMVINVGVTSWIVFIAIALAGVALIIAADRVLTVYKEFIEFKEAITISLLSMCLFFIPIILGWSTITIYEWLFYIVIMLMLILNKYRVKLDQQRTSYTIILFIFCVYLMVVMKRSEEFKELNVRKALTEQLSENHLHKGMSKIDNGYIRVIMDDNNNSHRFYTYSYAKYNRNGRLQESSGKYTYHKFLYDWLPGGFDGDNLEQDGYSHSIHVSDRGDVVIVSIPNYYFHLYYYLNVLYLFFIVVFCGSYSLIYHLNLQDPYRGHSMKSRIKNSINGLIFGLFIILTASTIILNSYKFRNRERTTAFQRLQMVCSSLEDGNLKSSDIEQYEALSELSGMLMTDINIYDAQSGRIVASSNQELFVQGYKGNLINPMARKSILEDGEPAIMLDESICGTSYKAVYSLIVLGDGSRYIVNIPYFIESEEFGRDIATIAIIAVNIAIVLMLLSFTFSAWLAAWLTQPLQVISDKLKVMRIGGNNERIYYSRNDEIGLLVNQYNETLEKLEDSVRKLSITERDMAWREMAKQIAHEVKNPLTPMKLNIQFLQRAALVCTPEEFKDKFSEIAKVLMEQIDTMAATASTFSDFAKVPNINIERFNLSDLLNNEKILFNDCEVEFELNIEPDVYIESDKNLISRVLINIIKNACQSIPDDRVGLIKLSLVTLHNGSVEIFVRDNGTGVDPQLAKKIFEPNFTTKTEGMGLGLAISKRIIEALGGSIAFRNIDDEGAEFVIILTNFVK